MTNDQAKHMDRGNPYESAIAAYLRARRVAYVATDEARRSLFDDEDDPVKSLDFIVHAPGGVTLLVDVKGRTFGDPRRTWENWSTADDLRALEHWQARHGPGAVGVLAFVYRLAGGVNLPADTPDLFAHAGRRYLVRAVAADHYRRHMRVRSPRWGTVCLPRAAYRELVRPFAAFVRPGPVLRALTNLAEVPRAVSLAPAGCGDDKG